MLVFSRKRDESIMIGDGIEVKVLGIGRDTIKLGISAPREIPIHRKEIYLAIEEENQAASQSVDKSTLDAIKMLVSAKRGANRPTGKALKKPAGEAASSSQEENPTGD